jgi:hypothetical protein
MGRSLRFHSSCCPHRGASSTVAPPPVSTVCWSVLSSRPGFAAGSAMPMALGQDQAHRLQPRDPGRCQMHWSHCLRSLVTEAHRAPKPSVSWIWLAIAVVAAAVAVVYFDVVCAAETCSGSAVERSLAGFAGTRKFAGGRDLVNLTAINLLARCPIAV